MWDPRWGERLPDLHAPKTNAFATPILEPVPHRHMSISPDGNLLAAASLSQEVRVWDISNPKKPELLKVRYINTNSDFSLSYARHPALLKFMPNGNIIVATGEGDMKEWDLKTDKMTALDRSKVTYIRR